MNTVRITKEFRFEGAHSLLNYDGKCKHIHGHSYILYVTVKGKINIDSSSPKTGMVVDFSDLKSIVNKNIVDIFDHALVLNKKSPITDLISDNYKNVIVVDFQPTSENLVCYFANILKEKLPNSIELFSIRLYETASSFVEWFASEN